MAGKLTPARASELGKLSVKSRRSLNRAAMKAERQLAEMGLAGDVLRDAKDIVVEIIRASTSNPIVGIFTVLGATSIGHKLGIIDDSIYGLMVKIVIVAFSLTEGASLAQDIPILGLLTGSGAQVDASLIKPSITSLTQVQAQGETPSDAGQSQRILKSLLAGIGPKVAAS